MKEGQEVWRRKVVGCLLFADGDLIAYPRDGVFCVGIPGVLVQSPSNNSMFVCLLADGGPARLKSLIEYDSPPDAGHSRLFGLSGCLMVSPLSWVFHMTAKEMSVVTRPKGLHRSISEGKSRWLY